jgi:hypothetical protein
VIKFIFSILLLSSVSLFGQNGTIRGTIIDDATGETVPFANVFVNETQTGTTSDLDGAFTLKLDPGTYTVEFSFIGYSTLNVSEVLVTADEITPLDVRMEEETAVLEEIVVTAKQIRNTEAAVLTIQKKAPQLLDGISSQTFKKIGDSNAASAIKRVTGVSVEGNKYVFVRGLGDRYTKSILNGMDVPGLDPDRNTLQLDIFPTNLIDNIIVLKSFTPDLPGDFTGGIVDIVTKDFPDEKRFNVSVGLSYNPSMHLRSNYITAAGSSTDWLGFDNGTRSLPIRSTTVIPDPIASDRNNAFLTDVTRSFSSNLGTFRQRSRPNSSFGFSGGNQINKDKATLGYNFALNYRNNTTFYDEVEFNTFRKQNLNSESPFELEEDRTQIGEQGSNNVLVSGLAGGAIKFGNHKFSLNVIAIQNGESKAGLFEQNSFIRTSNTLIRDNAEYSERTIGNVLLSGQHSFESGLNIDWKLSPTYSRIEDKDARVVPFRLDDGELSIEPSEGAEPRRIWRNLEEVNYSGRVDVSKKILIGERNAKLKFGLSNTIKNRDYNIIAYRINVRGQNFLDINGEPNQILAPENIWTIGSDIGSFIVGNFEPANTYEATQSIFSAYAMNEHEVNDKLKAVYGVRVEKFDHSYTGQNNLGDIVFDDEKIIDVTDVLPSVNLIYGVTENINVRTSFNKTLARPSFKEASIGQIYDPFTDRTYIGNIDLEETKINNYDARVEYFMPGGQLFAVSGFFKQFSNPIEVVAFSEATPNQFQPRNVGDAEVIGIELEARKNLSFVNENLTAFNIGANVSFIQSRVELDKSEGGEFESRLSNARPGEQIGSTRNLQGQSPYIINGFLNYRGIENGIDINLSYNVQGKRLSVVGIGRVPDVYEQPFHNLSFKASKRIGELSLSISVSNILDSRNQKFYESFNATSQIFESFRPARNFGFSLGYNF